MIPQTKSINLASNPQGGERRFDFEEGEAVLSTNVAKSNSAASDLTTSALMKCQYRCARSLRWKKPVQDVMLRPITKATRLRHSIEDRVYRPYKLDQVEINERGKKRLVRPQTFRDRTIQTWLCQEYLTPLAKAQMISDSYACLEGRGLDYAIDRVGQMIARAPMTAWVGQFDFKGYFASIDHALLVKKLLSYTDDELLRYLISTILSENIASERDGVGLELGACTSQVSATMFPDDVDRAALSTPGCIGYGRYMDDGIVIAKDRKSLERCMKAIRTTASKLKLTINESKTHINRINHPIVFCKHRFVKVDCGVEHYVRAPQINHMRRHIRKVRRKSARSPTCIDLVSIFASYKGYLQRDNRDLLHFLEATE